MAEIDEKKNDIRKSSVYIFFPRFEYDIDNTKLKSNGKEQRYTVKAEEITKYVQIVIGKMIQYNLIIMIIQVVQMKIV